MSDETPRDMEDCEYRSEWGTPDMTQSPVTRPIANIHAPVNGPVNQSTDNSTNKPLPWIAMSMLLAGFSVAISIWAISSAREAETQLLLLREDIRQMTIEAVKHGKD